jgi:hypothetical protein
MSQIRSYYRLREWADKILDNLPFKCPVYQCGGFKNRRKLHKPEVTKCSLSKKDTKEVRHSSH